MKKVHYLVIYCFLFFLIYLLFKEQSVIHSNIYEAIDLFVTRVFPSLFPMFIIADLLIAFNFPYYLNKYFSRFSNSFLGINGASLYVFIMSLISGTPTNAMISKELVNGKYIDGEEAGKVMSFTVFANPVFLYTMLTLSFSPFLSLMIILNNYLSSFILARFIKSNNTSNYKISYNNSSFSKSLINSITKNLNIMMMILGTMVVFNILSFNTGNEVIDLVLSNILELSNGLKMISASNLSHNIKMLVAVGSVSFVGLCIQLQIKSIINDTNINYLLFLKRRLFHLVISLITFSIMLIVI